MIAAVIVVKSVAAFKRALAGGASIEIVEHFRAELAGTVRKPTELQTNGYWWRLEDGRRSWFAYPLAKNWLFNADGVIQIRIDVQRPIIAVRLLEAEQSA